MYLYIIVCGIDVVLHTPSQTINKTFNLIFAPVYRSSNNRVQLDWNLDPKIPILLRIMVHIRPLDNEVFRSCENERWEI